MSNIAIRFYEILYDFKKGTFLQQKGNVLDWIFAGDTMNSYETIAKFASDKKKREWREKYHCLANF